MMQSRTKVIIIGGTIVGLIMSAIIILFVFLFRDKNESVLFAIELVVFIVGITCVLKAVKKKLNREVEILVKSSNNTVIAIGDILNANKLYSLSDNLITGVVFIKGKSLEIRYQYNGKMRAEIIRSIESEITPSPLYRDYRWFIVMYIGGVKHLFSPIDKIFDLNKRKTSMKYLNIMKSALTSR